MPDTSFPYGVIADVTRVKAGVSDLSHSRGHNVRFQRTSDIFNLLSYPPSIKNNRRVGMNWDAIGAIGEIMGAVVVVVTLFYLAAQIKQNNQSNLMVAAGRLGDTTDAWMRQLVQDAELHDLYHKGLRDYEALEERERRRFNMLIFQFLKSIESAWAQKDLGVLNTDQWYGYEVSIRDIVGSSGGLIVLEKVKRSFSQNFNTMIDEVLAAGKR